MQNLKGKIKEGVIILFLFLLALVLFVVVIQFGTTNLGKENADVRFGVTFSKLQAESLGLDWKGAYLATLDDLGTRLVRIPIYWNDVESEEGVYDFRDYGWMVEEAQVRGVSVIPVIGMRVPRWPECHIPPWAGIINYSRQSGIPQIYRNTDQGAGQLPITKQMAAASSDVVEKTPEAIEQDQQLYHSYLRSKILLLLEEEVKEFKGYPNILYWQVENEPLLGSFGECPFHDLEFTKAEFGLVKRLDPNRPVMATDSGELSSWIDLAETSDVLGVSLYRRTFNKYFGIFFYPLPPLFYQKKIELISHLVDATLISELQAEPWVEGVLADYSVEGQLKNFSLSRMKDTISFAKKTEIDPILLWGVEWWYTMKEKKHPEYWNYAKTLFGEEN